MKKIIVRMEKMEKKENIHVILEKIIVMNRVMVRYSKGDFLYCTFEIRPLLLSHHHAVAASQEVIGLS